jgi:phosphoribosylaminoimidazole-succinocarboxamide synthase
MRDYAAFDAPIVTPTTKEAVGVHDQPTSLEALVASGRVTKKHLDAVVEAARALFRLGSEHARSCGLILVDTKYEFGLVDDKVVLIDEIHTADSSRFWVRSSYAERVAKQEAPEMLDKENLRRWLIARGFSGSGTPPALTDDVRVDLAAHYWDLTERVLGRAFKATEGTAADRVRAAVQRFVA